MNTKQLFTLIGCCTFSALLAVVIYRAIAYPVVSPLNRVDAFSLPVSTLATAPSSFSVAADLTTPSVVYIRSYYQASSRWEPNAPLSSSSGSGIIISPDGLIATNNHVITGAQRIKVMLPDQQEYEAEVLGVDPATDLALLKIAARGLPFLAFGNSDSLRVGEWVLAIGNPFNLESTVTAGIVSAKGRSIDVLEGDDRIESFIQTDAAVNPGNSGGALVNERGELVGINTAIITNSGRHEGFAFAIPGNLARRILEDLRDFGEVERAVIGVYVQKMNAAQARQLGISETQGALVTKIRSGGAAEEAGLEVGDVILTVNKATVTSPSEMQEVISKYRPGDRITVSYIRKKKEEKLLITLRDKNNSTHGRRLAGLPEIDPLRQWGFEVRALSATEQNQLHLSGLRVISIFRNTKIAATNMTANYIIVKANGQAVSQPTDLLRIIEGATGEVTLEGYYEGYEGAYFYQFR